MACYSQVYDLLHYTGTQHNITVHHGSESYGLIAHHWTSRFGNSMSLAGLWFSTTLGTLGSDMGYHDGAMHCKPCTVTRDKNAYSWTN
jgi:hypothetical protein